MHVVIVNGGELPDPRSASVRELCVSADLLVAADHGLDHCQRMDGLWPDVLVGDFDSADAELVATATAAGVEVLPFPVDKDATDLELALEVGLERGAQQITVVAAFGGRLDHELATVGLLTAEKFASVPMYATDGRRHLWVVRDSVELNLDPGATLSLIPWSDDVAGVSVAGVQWPLVNATLLLGTTHGVSNVCVSEKQTVALVSGTLLVVADVE